MNAMNMPQEPYASARDLPSFREMEQNIEGMQLLLSFAPASERVQLKSDLRELSAQSKHLVSLVDAFYDKLGNRNWIFSTDLSLKVVETIVAIDDPLEAEKALIEYYRSNDGVHFAIKRLARLEAMRPRLPLLRAALEDYKHARNYSVVLVLIAVMDGFVNDFDKQSRKGLHAREAAEMFAWDNIVGHHMGLTNAHKAFTKTFKKTVTEEVYDLHRHGIVHGMITNFDNYFVSTKAWNHLFAIGDWADAQLMKTEKSGAPPEPSLDEVVQQYRQLQDDKARRDRFQPYDCIPGNVDCDALRAADDFFARWSKRQWGPLGAHFMQCANNHSSAGQLAREARELYEDYSLNKSSIQRIEHCGSMVAHVHASLSVNGQTHTVEMRWVHVDDEFNMVDEWEQGHWVLVPYGPLTFIKNEV
ncbi:hypothetical protein [Brevibacterium renqingii]|uniref:hypothetical protein n=1 Tax=Brevibacterium renqingii TaxID=2776916 RepID=UPI001AE05FB1|nr:hypothetical protein [Brevibacterium renqingii]